MKVIHLSNSKPKFISSPRIDASDVKDISLKREVEAIGPTRWWKNTYDGSGGYTFEVKPNHAPHSSFQMGLDSNKKIFQFFGRVFYNNDLHMFSDESQLPDYKVVLNAMAKPSAEEIINAFRNDVGLTEDK